MGLDGRQGPQPKKQKKQQQRQQQKHPPPCLAPLTPTETSSSHVHSPLGGSFRDTSPAVAAAVAAAIANDAAQIASARALADDAGGGGSNGGGVRYVGWGAVGGGLSIHLSIYHRHAAPSYLLT